MTAQEILRHLEAVIMEDIGYHLTQPEGRLEHYHFMSHIRDIDRDITRRWVDLLTQIHSLILDTKPFCMIPPDDFSRLEATDVATGSLIRVCRIYDVRLARQAIHIDWYGRVFNEPS